MENYLENFSVLGRNFDLVFFLKVNIVGKKLYLFKCYKCVMCVYCIWYKLDLNWYVCKYVIVIFSCDICNMFFKIIGNVEFYKWKEYVYLMEELFLKEIMKYMCKMCMYVIMYSLDLICYVRKYYIVKFYCILCNKFFMIFGSFVYYKRFVYGV